MHMSRGVHGTGRARQCRHEHASTHKMHARVCMVRAVRAGACTSCSHFDALQRRHVRRSWSTAAYFESSRVYRHVILSKELQTLPWGLESTPRSRWHPLGACAGSRLQFHEFRFVKNFRALPKSRTPDSCTLFGKCRKPGFCLQF